MILNWKRNNTIPQGLNWELYPDMDEPTKLHSTPRIHKKWAPLRPIVSSCRNITYKAAQYPASILSPLGGTTICSTKNSNKLADMLRDLEVPPGQKLTSVL